MSSMVKVAREANVAVSTVSLALNHRERVKPETRERIEQAMVRLGYQPRGKTSEPAPQKSVAMRVAFIYTLDSLNPVEDPRMTTYCRALISGMQEFLSGSASYFSIFRGAEHIDNDSMVNEQINANEFDGVVLFGPEKRNGYLERLQQSGLPLVVINRPPEHGRFSCVTLDYFGGAKLAIEHLISLGHRRIATAMSDMSGKWLSREVVEGAHEAFSQHGIKPVIEVQHQDLDSQENLVKFCKQLRKDDVTALFTGDYLAIRCIDALQELGVRVPEEISVIGFDDRGQPTGSGLTLTSIGYDKKRMGRLAMQTLQRLFQSKGQLKWLSSAVATYLVEGQTTTQAPQNNKAP
jgi:LacI family transcriptional regulator